MMDKRMKKLEVAAKEIPVEQKIWVHGDAKADIGVLTWGTCKGAVRDALDTLREEGIKIKMVEARLMWPLPADEIEAQLGECKVLVAIEQNYSAQFAGLVTQYAGLQWDHEIVKYNGRPMSYNELLDALRGIAKAPPANAVKGRKATNRVVLTHGH
ncbi:MAG: transketolase C-terminal domain-containing protein [bacterium]